MTTTPITRNDLDNLAQKIATLTLSEHEQAVALAVFALATDALGRTLTDIEVRRSTPGVSVEVTGTLPDLETIFDQAFEAASTVARDGGGSSSDDTVLVRLGKIGR
jgi:hypothetical protein